MFQRPGCSVMASNLGKYVTEHQSSSWTFWFPDVQRFHVVTIFKMQSNVSFRYPYVPA